jgi:hypothetical protein
VQRRGDGAQAGGAKAQPGGMAQGSGTPPGIAESRRRGPSTGGSAPISPRV